MVDVKIENNSEVDEVGGEAHQRWATTRDEG
jgi:hypothetical protein